MPPEPLPARAIPGAVGLLLALLVAVPAGRVSAAEEAAAALYLREIKPVLAERCYACHGVLQQRAGLRLDTAESLLAGAENGPVAVPGDPEAGTLLERLTTGDAERRMPLDAHPLTPDQIEAVRAWILAGAPRPPGEQGEPDPLEHWSYQRIERPPLPTGAGEAGHPVDAFLAARQAERGLVPQPEAERPLLLRRLHLDLVGLPPTPAQLDDSRPYEAIVEELLASPQHGERWARHWMDVWRYSDAYGLGAQLRNSQKHLWRWRDWIVDSLNADKGYDRMVLEMLAGDELAPEDPEVLAATGFLARNYYLFNRTTWLDDTIEHTGKAFLGLTLNCAKCHDHKYDAISMVDYYRFRALFEPHQVRLDPVPGVVDFEQDGLPRVFDDHLEAPTFLHLRGDPAQPDESAAIAPGVPEVFADFAPGIEPVALPLSAWAPATRPHVREDRLAAADRAVAEAAGELAEARARKEESAAAEDEAEAAGEATGAGDPDRSLAVAEAKHALALAERERIVAVLDADLSAVERGAAAGEALAREAARREAGAEKAAALLEIARLEQGDDEKKRKEAREALEEAERRLADGGLDYRPLRAAKKALETPEHKDETYGPTYPPTSTGRRLMLARWIVHRDNPFAARVAVNQVWMRHFGEPLVETVFDFGRQAPPPEHLELLDWLAAEFMESGWSFRHLHRLLVTSEAYRRGASNLGADPATLAADPANRFYWRAHPRRMESQVVRDSLLHLAGNLDLALGGPSLDPAKASAGPARRSLYFLQSRDDQDRFLAMFDDASILACYRREESVVPQQALALANSQLSIDAAASIAERVASELPGDAGDGSGGIDEAFAAAAFRLVLSREPGAEELRACLDFGEALGALESVRDAADPALLTRARLVHALLNHNDFVTVR